MQISTKILHKMLILHNYTMTTRERSLSV